MGIITLFIILIAVGVVMYFIGDSGYIEFMAIFGIASSIISSFCLGVCLIMLIDLDKRFQNKIQNYNSLKEVIEYNRENMSPLERVELIKEIHEMNKTINLHKTYCNSNWVGVYYSKEVGDLEILK